MFDLEDNDPLINEFIELMEKMSSGDRQVVLNYTYCHASQRYSTIHGKIFYKQKCQCPYSCCPRRNKWHLNAGSYREKAILIQARNRVIEDSVFLRNETDSKKTRTRLIDLNT
jgi:hypothetical protein